MKNLRRLSIAVAFTLALAIPAFADGEISTPLAPPPPPQAQTATTDGEISTPLTGQAETGSSETTATDSATGAALNLLQSVLSLF
jgi:FlaG/FlaF family flagellin (archaellin)